MDDVCLIRSMTADHGNHFAATLQMHTGSFSFARPSLGSWVNYGLGTENQNLPSFIVLAPHLPNAGGQVWANDFLPGVHQGVRVVPGADPMPNGTIHGASDDYGLSSPKTASTSTTCKPPSSIYSGSITSNSHSATAVATTGSPMSSGTWCMIWSREARP